VIACTIFRKHNKTPSYQVKNVKATISLRSYRMSKPMQNTNFTLPYNDFVLKLKTEGSCHEK